MLVSNFHSNNLLLNQNPKNSVIKSNQNINLNHSDSISFTSNKGSDLRNGIVTATAILALCATEFVALKSNVVNNIFKKEPENGEKIELVQPSTAPIGSVTTVEMGKLEAPVQDDLSPDNTIKAQTVTPREISKFGNIIHIKYDEASQSELESVGNNVSLKQSAAVAYKKMVSDAKNDGVNIIPLSGFRSVDNQNDLFYGVAKQRGQTPAQRAFVSAPPGFSEHHTGYAIDVGDGSNPSSYLSKSFEDSQASKWLMANMSKYGFELSFPRNNSQHVSYEPWHIRFVGDEQSQSEFTFAKSLSGKSSTQISNADQ
ncbi:MAG: M15 family metallopeptidase [bacterium]